MRSNRRKNWFIKRIALGLAIAAVAAPVAQAKVDEGRPVRPGVNFHAIRRPSIELVQSAAALDPSYRAFRLRDGLPLVRERR